MGVFSGVAMLYVVGSGPGVTRVGTGVREWLAPTQQELQRSASEIGPAMNAIQAPAETTNYNKPLLTDPMPMRQQFLVLGGIMVIVLAAMYLTGR